MFHNYLKIALQNISNQKAYSLINISGLAVGMACCFIIVLYVGNELSYDQYHRNREHIYRLVNDFEFQGEFATSPIINAPGERPSRRNPLHADYASRSRGHRAGRPQTNEYIRRGL